MAEITLGQALCLGMGHKALLTGQEGSPEPESAQWCGEGVSLPKYGRLRSGSLSYPGGEGLMENLAYSRDSRQRTI